MSKPPALLNAFSFQGKTWYGQITRGGRLVSLSSYLDVIGHELTHGVIESTSKLVYRNQSGALNESFADIAESSSRTGTPRGPTRRRHLGLGAQSRPARERAAAARPLDPSRRTARAHERARAHDSRQRRRPHQQQHLQQGRPYLLTMTKGGSRVFTVHEVVVLTYVGMARLVPLPPSPTLFRRSSTWPRPTSAGTQTRRTRSP